MLRTNCTIAKLLWPSFKCMTGQAPEYLTFQFITDEQVSEVKTRSSQKLNIPLFRTASRERTGLLNFGIIWNLFLS